MSNQAEESLPKQQPTQPPHEIEITIPSAASDPAEEDRRQQPNSSTTNEGTSQKAAAKKQEKEKEETKPSSKRSKRDDNKKKKKQTKRRTKKARDEDDQAANNDDHDDSDSSDEEQPPPVQDDPATIARKRKLGIGFYITAGVIPLLYILLIVLYATSHNSKECAFFAGGLGFGGLFISLCIAHFFVQFAIKELRHYTTIGYLVSTLVIAMVCTIVFASAVANAFYFKGLKTERDVRLSDIPSDRNNSANTLVYYTSDGVFVPEDFSITSEKLSAEGLIYFFNTYLVPLVPSYDAWAASGKPKNFQYWATTSDRSQTSQTYESAFNLGVFRHVVTRIDCSRDDFCSMINGLYKEFCTKNGQAPRDDVVFLRHDDPKDAYSRSMSQVTQMSIGLGLTYLFHLLVTARGIREAYLLAPKV